MLNPSVTPTGPAVAVVHRLTFHASCLGGFHVVTALVLMAAYSFALYPVKIELRHL